MNRKITVLIIDDEEDIRRILAYELKLVGFNVYSASNGQAGLKIATEKKPDVILLDWVMPKMNGLTVLSKIRHDERTKDIIVLMLTAKNMMDDVETALANGADDYIPKPFERAGLGPRIMSIFGVLREQKSDRSAPQKLMQGLREDNRQ
jgi:DNA-binding response OmpR family regulator